MNTHTTGTSSDRYQLPLWASALVALIALTALGGSVYWYLRDAGPRAIAIATPVVSARQSVLNQLWDQIAKGDLFAIQATLATDGTLATTKNPAINNATPLHTAAWHGQIAIATFLLDKGADPNIVENEYNGTPLSWAIVSGQKPMVELLLSRGGRAAPDFVGIAEAGARGEFKKYASSPVSAYPPIVELLKSKQ